MYFSLSTRAICLYHGRHHAQQPPLIGYVFENVQKVRQDEIKNKLKLCTSIRHLVAVCKSQGANNYYSVILLVQNKQLLIDAWAPEPINNNPCFLTIIHLDGSQLPLNRKSLASPRKRRTSYAWTQQGSIQMSHVRFQTHTRTQISSHWRYGTNFTLSDYTRTTHTHKEQIRQSNQNERKYCAEI